MKTSFPPSAFPAAQPLRILIAGGSGFLGSLLAQHHAAQGHSITILTRKPPAMGRAHPSHPLIRFALWDGSTLGPWARELEGSDVLINLAGRSVNCRYNPHHRDQILQSRIQSTRIPTRILGVALGQCSSPPPLWINASTATIYSHTQGDAWDEQGETSAHPEARDEFSVEVAKAWESTLFDARTPHTRKIALRLAMVLGHHSHSVWPTVARLVHLRLGGRWSHGRQFMSWIHTADFCKAIDWLISHPHLSGPLNLAAPQPVTNAEFMRTARRALGVSWGLPAPAWMLEWGTLLLRTEMELLIKSRRVLPARLLEDGFTFTYPHLPSALENLATPPIPSTPTSHDHAWSCACPH